MGKSFRVRLPMAALFIFGMVSVNGCLDFGDSGDDAHTSDTPQGIVDDIATGATSVAVDATVGMLEGMIEWTSEGFGTPTRGTQTYDEVRQLWVIEESETYQDEEVTGQLDITYEVQFLASGSPQRLPDELTDEIQIGLSVESVGNYDPGTYEVDFAWIADANLTGVRASDNSVDFTGGGTLDGITTTQYQEITYTDEQAGSWTYYLAYDPAAAPDRACVTGNLVGSVDDFSFTAEFGKFDGQDRVVWSVSRDGTVIDSSDRSYDCVPQP